MKSFFNILATATIFGATLTQAVTCVIKTTKDTEGQLLPSPRVKVVQEVLFVGRDENDHEDAWALNLDTERTAITNIYLDKATYSEDKDIVRVWDNDAITWNITHLDDGYSVIQYPGENLFWTYLPNQNKIIGLREFNFSDEHKFFIDCLPA